MATNLGIDERLLRDAQKQGKHKTKRETVDDALREYIARRRRREILRLAGKVSWNPRYDYKKDRKSR
jgi:Arc/MetJ family transcription regulator